MVFQSDGRATHGAIMVTLHGAIFVGRVGQVRSGRGLVFSTSTRSERAALRHAQQETTAAAVTAPSGEDAVDGTDSESGAKPTPVSPARSSRTRALTP